MASPSSPPPAPARGLLDAAAAAMLPAARETLLAALDAGWADPRRLYAEGRRAHALLDQARDVLADGLGVRPDELSFHPGGAIAMTAALDGIAHAGRRRGLRAVASAVEHSSVLTWGRHRVAHHGSPPGSGEAAVFAEVPVDRLGRVDVAAFEEAVRAPGTVVAALQSANGEVGTRQPVVAVRSVCADAGVPLVVDATAGLGREAPPSSFDALVGDARSFGGPPGVGLLGIPARTRWLRPGPATEWELGRSDAEPVVALVLAAAEAWRATAVAGVAEATSAAALVERIRVGVASIPDVEVAGDPDDRLPNVVTFSFLYVDGEALVSELDRRGLALASGSACTASTLEPSHVLAAMGVLTHGNVRVTLPLAAASSDREAHVDRLLCELPDVVRELRARVGATSW